MTTPFPAPEPSPTTQWGRRAYCGALIASSGILIALGALLGTIR